MENSCIKEKRFLFWKWKAENHDYTMMAVRRFMYSSTDFIVEWRCDKCGIIKEDHFVNGDWLYMKGILPSLLNNINTTKYFVSHLKIKL